MGHVGWLLYSGGPLEVCCSDFLHICIKSWKANLLSMELVRHDQKSVHSESFRHLISLIGERFLHLKTLAGVALNSSL